LALFLLLLGFGGVAFTTLLERKLLGLSQLRIGPNKVTLLGILQPVADGVKLLLKQLFITLRRQRLLFLIAPLLLIILFVLM
jgi:NADH-quinone oxidoreductase subunit H